MTPPRKHRLPAVLAGCLAVAASLTALGTILVSDIAQARDTVELGDDPSQPQPVKMSKVKVLPEFEPDLDLIEEPDHMYGNFEGY